MRGKTRPRQKQEERGTVTDTVESSDLDFLLKFMQLMCSTIFYIHFSGLESVVFGRISVNTQKVSILKIKCTP